MNIIKYIYIIIFLLHFTSCDFVSDEQENASNYNDLIVEKQKKADSLFLNTVEKLETSESKNLLITYENNRNQTIELIKQLKANNTGFNDTVLYPALVILVETYLSFYENELAELVDIILKNPDEISELDFELIYMLYDSINNTYESSSNQFIKVQKEFAEIHNLKLK
jgi:hypothetical protein